MCQYDSKCEWFSLENSKSWNVVTYEKGCICVLSHIVLFLWLQIWFQVKAANQHLSVCQIGATIGRMWRELSEAEKQRHLEEFQQDKVS